MIVGSMTKLEIGAQKQGICKAEPDGSSTAYQFQPFVVLREATRDEWWEEIVRVCGDNLREPYDSFPGSYFYEVSID